MEIKLGTVTRATLEVRPLNESVEAELAVRTAKLRTVFSSPSVVILALRGFFFFLSLKKSLPSH